jgi:competence protein ComEC
VLANLLGMSAMSFVVMPAGLAALVLMPFGYDAIGWHVMGSGIDTMLSIARWVSALPGSEGRVAAFGTGTLLSATAALLLLAIPAGRLRLAGLPFLALAALLFVSAPRPDVLVSADGSAVAVRGDDGKLRILNARGSRLEASSWLAADADGRVINNQLAAGFACDEAGCITRMADGMIIAAPKRPEAFADDCKEAALIVTTLNAPAFCKPPVIDRRTLATTGAMALRRVDGRWVAETGRSPYADRPWYGRAAPPDASALSRLSGAMKQASAPPPDTQDDLSDEAPTPDLPEMDDQ